MWKLTLNCQSFVSWIFLPIHRMYVGLGKYSVWECVRMYVGLGTCSKYAPYFFTCVCEQFEHLFRDRVEVSGTILESIQRSVITRSQHRRASLETWVHSEHTGIISTVPTLTLPSTKELSKDLCLR